MRSSVSYWRLAENPLTKHYALPAEIPLFWEPLKSTHSLLTMLDVQRYRGETFRMEVAYARKVMWCHLLTGTSLITLLLFHEQFWWFGGTLAWFAATVMAMLGYMSQVNLCRWVLGGLFLIACSTGVYFTTEVYPALIAPKAPILPQNFIPIWAGMANLIYACCAALVFFSSKIRRAGSVGFTLW